MDDLTFEQYKELISHAKVWPHFENLWIPERPLNVDLNDIATIRNEIFHRKRAGNADDRLRRFRDHKIRYYRKFFIEIQTVKET